MLMPAQTGKIKTYTRTQSTAIFKAAPRAHGLTIMPREAGDYGYQKKTFESAVRGLGFRLDASQFRD